MSFWILDCDSPVIGDGYCDDRFNFGICNFDNGDCCGSNVNKLFCLNCFCFQETDIIEDTCQYTKDVQNGICDDFANTQECAYDKG
jgi:hypothetical protein